MAALRVFRPVVAEGFEWVQPVAEADHDALYQLDGTPRAAGWRPIRVRRLEADEKGRPWRTADPPWLSGMPLSSVTASTGRSARCSPAQVSSSTSWTGTDRLWLFNVCQVVDALDEEASGVVRFSTTGRVMKVKQHVFHPERLAGLSAFRVPQSRSLFLSGEAVDSIGAANLTGAGFELVWQS